MSKIGRKPISFSSSVQVEIKGNTVHFKGAKEAGTYDLPKELVVTLEDKQLKLMSHADQKGSRDINRIWGLHRALLANKIKGVDTGFERKLEINGLGFKAVLSGSKIVFSLGYTHKIDFDLPKGIVVEIDKTGQKLRFKSADNELLGHVCSVIKALRPPEPYKGKGIKFESEVIARKAGKAKASAG